MNEIRSVSRLINILQMMMFVDARNVVTVSWLLHVGSNTSKETPAGGVTS